MRKNVDTNNTGSTTPTRKCDTKPEVLYNTSGLEFLCVDTCSTLWQLQWKGK